jgi:predicted phage-related endonuclease
MTPIQQLRLNLGTTAEELATAHTNLREAENFENPDTRRDCLTDARQAIDNLIDEAERIAKQIDNLINAKPKKARATLGLRLTR